MNPVDALLWVVVFIFGLVALFGAFLIVWFIVEALQGKR